MVAMGTCLSSPNGFYPNRVAIEPSSSSPVVNRGILAFERNGTGRARVTQTGLNVPPAAFSYSGSAEISFDFTYAVMDDGTVTVDMLLATYSATYLTGPAAGMTAAFVTDPPLSPFWRWSGMISEDRKTMLLSNGDTVSKVRLSTNAISNVICQFERVLARLGPERAPRKVVIAPMRALPCTCARRPGRSARSEAIARTPCLPFPA